MRIVLLFCLSFLLVGCADDRPERLQANLKTADHLIQTLGTQLDTNRIRNATVLKNYAAFVTQIKPTLSPLFNELAKDATRNGPMYRSLADRLATLKTQPDVLGDIDAQLLETKTLIEASDVALFNDALSDPINVIADMSDGKLPRVNAISQVQSLKANNAENNGAGSQLVGNPNYGSWQTNSSGLSFWHWYGMYSMFSNFNSRPIAYDRWSSRRNYSYYSDVGRNRYTSPKQKRSQETLIKRHKKTFSSKKGSFDSTYAKPKTGASSISSASKKAQRTSSFASKSSYSKQKSSSSGFRSSTSSFRNSSSTTSRGISRGK